MTSVIEVKTQLGEKAYVIDQRDILEEKDCLVCKGTGIVLMKGEPYKCSNFKCNKGKVQAIKARVWEVNKNPVKITRITCYSGKAKSIYASYNLTFNEDRVFGTKEEAQEECDKRNKKGKQ